MRKREKYGTRKSLVRRLWAAIRKTSKLLDSDDPQTVLKATHALATIAAAYRAAYAEMEAEETAKGGPRGKPLPPQIDPYLLWLIKRDVYGLDEPPPPPPEDPREYARVRGIYEVARPTRPEDAPHPALPKGEEDGEA